jgi:hypothetical protein
VLGVDLQMRSSVDMLCVHFPPVEEANHGPPAPAGKSMAKRNSFVKP